MRRADLHMTTLTLSWALRACSGCDLKAEPCVSGAAMHTSSRHMASEHMTHQPGPKKLHSRHRSGACLV